jgi:hypothetical protein
MLTILSHRHLYNKNGRDVVLAHIAVTTSAELPSIDGVDGFILHEGSKCWDITNSIQYGLTSDGVWHEWESGTSIVTLKGRVNTVSDLPGDAQAGWMYFVGLPTDTELSEYVYTDSGNWEYIGANVITIDSALSSASENPVQNKVITNALSGKVDVITGKGLSTEDYTTAEKTKVAGIEDGANKTVVDANLSQTSTNPVQNKTVNAALAVKQDKLTFDSAPTESSTNPVTSGGVWTDQQRQETEIGAVAVLGAKNAFNPADYIANSRSGVTITYNGDGAYSLSGTPTQTSDYLYTPDNVYNDLYGLQAGQPYTISTGVESSKVLVRIIPSYDGVSYDWSRTLVNNASAKATFTIPDDVVGLLIDFRSTANAGSLNGIVLKPMLRPASITDDTFVPYAKTNRELTVAGDEDRAALVAQVDGGAKNLAAPLDLASRSDLTITNDNGQYTISGITTSAFTGYLFRPTEPLQINTDYVLIGAEQLTGLDYIVAYKKTASSSMKYENIGTQNKILPSGAVISYIYVQQNTSGTVVSAKINLMLCTVADYTISPAIVPYRPSWQEMWEMIQALQSGS